MKKVSIIMPIYNVEKYIKRCIESVLNQTYDNIEVICIDDCGKDKSMEIVEKYYQQYPAKIKIVRGKSNAGLGAARDKGIEISTGDYISFIDSDDFIKWDFIEQYMDIVEKTSADVIAGGYIRSSGKGIKEFLPDAYDDMYVWTNVSVCSKVFKKRFLIENSLNFQGVRRYEDEGFMYRVLLSKPKIEIFAYAGYYYCLNLNSITRSKKVNRADIFYEYSSYIAEVIKSLKSDDKTEELLNYCLASGLTANLLYNGKGCGRRRMKLLYDNYDAVLKLLGNNIQCNKYISLKFLKSEPFKKRYATWLIMKFRCLGIDKLLFVLDSIL